MLQGILVGLDGSVYGPIATMLGIEWAKSTNATVVGIGIIDQPGITAPSPSPMVSGTVKQERDNALLEDAERLTSQFLEQFSLTCTAAGVSFKVLQESGSPDKEIVEESQRYDVVILGRQTFYKFETQEGADDTLNTVVKVSPRPVVVVPEQLPRGKNVIVAYDGSVQSARALQLFVLSGIPTKGEIHIVSIHSDKIVAAKTADRAVQYLRLHGLEATPHRPDPSGTNSSLLLDYVKKCEAGLLVMGAYGDTAWKSFVFGSTTRTLIRESPVPLFISH